MKIMDFIKNMSNRTNYEKNNRNQQNVEAMDLYKKLSTEIYNQYPCQTKGLENGMSIVKQVFGEYWKPRYLMDNNVKVAFEFINNKFPGKFLFIVYSKVYFPYLIDRIQVRNYSYK